MSNKNIGRDGDHDDKWQAGKCAYISLGSFDGKVCADPQDNDLDFAMLTPPTRPGPCKAATSPEVDPVEARLAREIESAPYRVRIRPLDEPPMGLDGSGKVKV